MSAPSTQLIFDRGIDALGPFAARGERGTAWLTQLQQKDRERDLETLTHTVALQDHLLGWGHGSGKRPPATVRLVEVRQG